MATAYETADADAHDAAKSETDPVSDEEAYSGSDTQADAPADARNAPAHASRGPVSFSSRDVAAMAWRCRGGDGTRT